MKKTYTLFFSLIPFTLFALPQGGNVKSGTAVFSTDKNVLSVEVSDRAIIDYESFNIEVQEIVEFIQPKSSSTLLNRVQGGDPSKILGNLVSNGKVFLVNPNGVYFGPDAVVDARSFVASTLDILNQDFLDQNYCFSLRPGTETALIRNEGTLSAFPGGVIALLAPQVVNEGTIIADIGQVFLASAEKVTIDFMGDGLLQFAVEGLMKEGGLAGKIALDRSSAQKILEDVVNTDGFIIGSELIEKEGLIHLVANSRIDAEEITIIGANVEIEGSVYSSWDMHIEAEDILCIRDRKETPLLLHAKRHLTMNSPFIDILAWENPDTFIGSNGNLTLVSDNPISADGSFSAGGDFSLLMRDGRPADFLSYLDPIVTSLGSVTFGTYSGASLKVEAAGNITCTGSITITMPDASACSPSGCSADPDCSALTTTSTLILIAGTTPASMTCNSVTNSSLVFSGTTFSNPGGSGNDINFTQTSTTILSGFTTATFTGNVSTEGNLRITSSGGAGDVVQFNDNLTVIGALTVNCGAFNAVGNVIVTPSSISITTVGPIDIAGSTQANTTCSLQSTAGGAVSVGNVNTIFSPGTITIDTTGPIVLQAAVSPTSIISNSNAAITITGSSLDVSNNQEIQFSANGGTITIDCPIGSIAPPNSVSVVNTSNIITQSITTGSGGISINNPCTAGGTFETSGGPVSVGALTLTSDLTISTADGAIDLSTVDGSSNLTLTAGTGVVTLGGAVGGGTPLNNFQITSSGGINLGADITTTVNLAVLFTGPITLTADSNLTLAGAPTFTSTIDGDFDFTLSSEHTIAFQGSIGSNVPLNNFSVQSYFQIDLTGLSITANDAIAIQHPSGFGILTLAELSAGSGGVTIETANALNLSGDISADNGPISFSFSAGSPLVTIESTLSINAGTSTITCAGPITATTAGVGLTLGGTGPISLSKNITMNNGAVTIAGPLTVTSSSFTISTSGGQVNLEAVDGAVAFTFDAGSGAVNFNGDLGDSTPLTSLSVTSGTCTIGGSMTTTGNMTLDGANSMVVSAAVTLTSSAGAITFQTPSIDNLSSLASGSLTLSSLGNITFTGVSGIGLNHPLRAFSILMADQVVLPPLVTELGGASITATDLTLVGNITTNNGALAIYSPFSMSNSVTLSSGTGLMTLGGSVTSSVSGNSFTAISSDEISLTGDITTNDGTITITGPLTLNATSTLSSSGGAITLSSIDGAEDFTANAAAATVDLQGAVGSTTPLLSFTVDATTINLGNAITTQGGAILLNGNVVLNNTAALTTTPDGAITFAGTLDAETSGVEGLMLVSGTGMITFDGDIGDVAPLGSLTVNGGIVDFNAISFQANTQSYTGGPFNFVNSTTLTSSGGIAFSGEAIQLLGGNFFIVHAGRGGFSFDSLMGTGQNTAILVQGPTTLGATQTLNQLAVISQQILLNGEITVNQILFDSNTSILNKGLGQPISLTTTSIFETQGGTIGTSLSPINVDNPSGIVIAGTPSQLANFIGTTADNTIHVDPNNLPCPLIFNGVVIRACPIPPPPPPVVVVALPAREFYVPGIYSIYNNLGSDAYFLPEIVDDRYTSQRHNPLFVTQKRFVKPKPPHREFNRPPFIRQRRSM